jgi:hypothetical protein
MFILEMKGIILKIRKFAIEHPALVAFALGLAVTLAVGAAMGMLDQQQAFANNEQVGGGPHVIRH